MPFLFITYLFIRCFLFIAFLFTAYSFIAFLFIAYLLWLYIYFFPPVDLFCLQLPVLKKKWLMNELILTIISPDLTSDNR